MRQFHLTLGLKLLFLAIAVCTPSWEEQMWGISYPLALNYYSGLVTAEATDVEMGVRSGLQPRKMQEEGRSSIPVDTMFKG